MFTNNPKKRLLLIIAILLVLVTVIALSWFFSSKTGSQSNIESGSIAKQIERAVAENFPINHNDTFWKVTLNLILRKVAHFLEYAMIGSVLCVLLNVLTKRVWISAGISLIVCPILAFVDEYRQKFVSGRTPRWFDVRVDSYGAILGIIIVTIVFLVLWRINKLKARIDELEEQIFNEAGFK